MIYQCIVLLVDMVVKVQMVPLSIRAIMVEEKETKEPEIELIIFMEAEEPIFAYPLLIVEES